MILTDSALHGFSVIIQFAPTSGFTPWSDPFFDVAMCYDKYPPGNHRMTKYETLPHLPNCYVICEEPQVNMLSKVQ